MKIDVMENGTIRLKEVFNSVVFETSEGTQLAICMRDDGYEILFGEIWYKANKDAIVPIKDAVVPMNQQHRGRNNSLGIPWQLNRNPLKSGIWQLNKR